ncbi:hypothetical protein [Vibrio harveyi]|uniref:hypothetical protein n=1 Tax=Vibrio harveyi TaxID=669 RepID=UPI00217DAED0|nr:hypothetical protein [Vibrio harveyi]
MDETTVEMSADNLAELDMYVAELQSNTSTENQPNGSAEPESEVDTSEAFDALVETGLVVVEQAVSILKDIDFAFDETCQAKRCECGATCCETIWRGIA